MKTEQKLDGFSVIQYNGQVFDDVSYTEFRADPYVNVIILKDIISSNLLFENPEALREIKFDLEKFR